MLQDVMKGRRTEIEHLNGYVARRGDEMDIDTPFCDGIIEIVKRVQRGEIKPAPANIEPLKAVVLAS